MEFDSQQDIEKNIEGRASRFFLSGHQTQQVLPISGLPGLMDISGGHLGHSKLSLDK